MNSSDRKGDGLVLFIRHGVCNYDRQPGLEHVESIWLDKQNSKGKKTLVGAMKGKYKIDIIFKK